MRPKCDFCSTEDVRWTYPTRDFLSSAIPIRPTESLSVASAGGWAACQRCYELIQAGDRNGLADRSARLHPEAKRVPRRVLREAIRQLHDDFWAQREGDPVPSDPDEQSDPTRRT